MNIIDTAINYVSPKWGAQRQAYREISNLSYSQQKRNSVRRSTTESTCGPDHAQVDEHERLGIINSMRLLYREDPFITALIDTNELNIVGDMGPMIVPDSGDEGFDQELEDWWDWWCLAENCCSRKLFSFADSLSLMVKDEFLVGDTGSVRCNDGRIQLIESELITTPAKREADKRTRDGITQDRRGAMTTAWVGQWNEEGSEVVNHIPIRPEHFTLFGNVDRISSSRGISKLFSPLKRIYDIDDYQESEMVKQKFSALIGMKIKQANSNKKEGVLAGAAGKAAAQSATGDLSPKMRFGKLVTMKLGKDDDASFMTVDRPNQESVLFTQSQQRIICAAACQMPWELVVQKLDDANFTSSRAMFISYNRAIKKYRARKLTPYCRAVFEWRLRYAILNKEIKPKGTFITSKEIQRYNRNYDLIYPGYQFLNPKDEIPAAKMAVDSGFSNEKIECAKLGLRAGRVKKQRSKEIKESFDLEVPVLIGQPGQNAMTKDGILAPAKSEPAKENKPEKPSKKKKK